MFNLKKIIFLLLFIILSLIVRETPYINIFLIGKLWMFYLLVLFLFLFPLSVFPLFILLILFLLVAFILTIFKLTYFAESIGVVIYFLLWVIFLLKLKEFLKKEKLTRH